MGNKERKKKKRIPLTAKYYLLIHTAFPATVL